MELHPHRGHFRLLISTFFLGVCVIVIGVVYRFQEEGRFNLQSTGDVSDVRPTKSVENEEAKITKNAAEKIVAEPQFSLLTDVVAAKAGSQIKVILSGSSAGDNPVGYDALLSIEGGLYDIVSVKSLNADFNVLKFMKTGRVTLTGVLAPRVSKSTPWNNTELVEVVLKVKEIGKYKFTVLQSVGRESSKIMVKKGDSGSTKLPSASSGSVLVDITN